MLLKSKNNDKIQFMRDIFALLIIIWCINPEQRFYNRWIYGIILLGWIGTVLLTDFELCIEKLVKPYILVLFLWPLTRSILALFGKASFSIYLFTVPFVYILFWYYYHKEQQIKRFFLESSILYFILINAVSIGRLLINSNIARLLANGDKAKTEYLASPFTANYQHIYTLTLLIVAVLGILKFCTGTKKRQTLNEIIIDRRLKIELLLFLISGIVVVFMAQYSYAIIFIIVFGGIIWFYKPIQKKEWVFIIVSCILIGCILFSVLYIFATIVDNKYLLERLNECLNLVFTGNLSKDKDVYKRLHLYLVSINTFLKYPIFGIGGKVYLPSTIVGGHSEFLDCLAYYGIVGFLSFVSVLIINFRYVFKQIPNRVKYIYLITFLLFIVQSIINTCYGEQFLIGLYFIIPLLLLEVTGKNKMERL